MIKVSTQKEWFDRAQKVLPAAGFGNFDSSVILAKGQGSRVIDENGQNFLDLLIGSGPMLLGHGHQEVLEAVFEALPKGMTFFANNSSGIELAEEIVRAVPCAEQVRYVSSGGEADMYAIRLARAATSRSKVLKFEGGYHGMSAEAQMSLAPVASANFPQAIADSAGIPNSVKEDILVAPYNDLEFVKSLFDECGAEIAAIIVEPLQRIIPPQSGFLKGLKDIAHQHGALLIFDEIVTGFRFAYGGAQEHYGVVPDIATLGKIIGGGFPLAAIAASKQIMDHFDKSIVGAEGWLMQLGTLSGNPIASVAGLKTMEILSRNGAYETLRANGQKLMDIQSSHLSKAGIAHQIVGDQTLFDVIFTERPVNDYRDSISGDKAVHSIYNNTLRANSVLKSPSKIYPSLALTAEDFDLFESAVISAVQAVETAS